MFHCRDDISKLVCGSCFFARHVDQFLISLMQRTFFLRCQVYAVIYLLVNRGFCHLRCCCWDGCLSNRFFHLCTWHLELFRVPVVFLLVSLTQTLLSWMPNLAGCPTLGRFMVVPSNSKLLWPLWSWEHLNPFYRTIKAFTLKLFYILSLICTLPEFDCGDPESYSDEDPGLCLSMFNQSEKNFNLLLLVYSF